MNARTFVSVIAAVLLVTVAVAPAAAAQDGAVATQDEVDECMNADEGPRENGPPRFVAYLVPTFISDLIRSLPVPNFVKSFFGATTC